MCIGRPRRVFSQVLVMQLSISLGVAVLRVADSGARVPEEQQELIFMAGWPVKGPPRRGPRVLGPMLVRRPTERQGGVVGVGAREGGGAEFTVILLEDLTEPLPEQAMSVQEEWGDKPVCDGVSVGVAAGPSMVGDRR